MNFCGFLSQLVTTIFSVWRVLHWTSRVISPEGLGGSAMPSRWYSRASPVGRGMKIMPCSGCPSGRFLVVTVGWYDTSKVTLSCGLTCGGGGGGGGVGTGGEGAGDALEGGGGLLPKPLMAPSLCQASVSLIASAGFNGICNEQ